MLDSSRAGDNPVMIALRDIGKLYGPVTALHKTSLEVRAGEFLTLLGPSGSGKTTLLNMIAGMAFPTTGTISIDGRDVTNVPAARRGLGMVFQNYALMPHMTVFENIAFPLQIRRCSRDEIRRRVTEVLELIRLPHVADRKPNELSGGQQQRISIGRCIVYKPPLILMDEPLGALDKKLREQMQIEIKRIHQELGITMIYVTHDQEEALNMSDRIMLMNGGRVEQLGTPDDLYFRPTSQFAGDFVGSSNLIDAEIVEVADHAIARMTDKGICTLPLIDEMAFQPGLKGKILVRPESLELVDPKEVPGGANALHGTIADTLTTGATVKHLVRLSDNSILQVQELTNTLATRFKRGAEVCAVWPAAAGRFLIR